MKQTKTTKIALVSLLTALSVVLGYFLKIPTPTGILTLLDAGVFFTAFYFGSREGAVVGGLAGFLIDLLSGYPQWMFFSLVKCCCYLFLRNGLTLSSCLSNLRIDSRLRF